MNEPYRINPDDVWQVLQGDRIVATCETPQAARRLVAERNPPPDVHIVEGGVTIDELASMMGMKLKEPT